MRVSDDQHASHAGGPAFVPPRGQIRSDQRRIRSTTAFAPRFFGRSPELSADIAFLAGHGIPERILRSATLLASCRGTNPSQELFAAGFDRLRYWQILAEHLGLPFFADLADASLHIHAGTLTTDAVRLAASVRVVRNGALMLVVAPGRDEIPRLAHHLSTNPAAAGQVAIAAPETIRAFLLERRHTALTHYAVNRLSHVLPRLSARRLRAVEPEGAVALLGALSGLCLLAPGSALFGLGTLLTLFFCNCAFWKAAAAVSRPAPLRLEAVPSILLPTYTILVPLYREEAIVADLVRHLAGIDYPASKLQILLLLEADDVETTIAAACLAEQPIFELVILPPGGPRTKPKALTFALPFARGDLVVVYDAEDRPEPDQLRKAAAAFRERPGLGCVQAGLAPDNEDCALAKLFTIEYSANFQVLLPALSRWQVPLPLGGTSNHFPGIR